MPQNAAQLYQLILGAEQAVRGESLPPGRSPGALRRWYAGVAYPTATLPGLFVDEVLTPWGGRLVLPGSFEDADWALERLLLAVTHNDHELPETFVTAALAVSSALLDLSHTVVQRSGLSAPHEAEHRPGQDVSVPSGSHRKRLLASVSFTREEFEAVTGAVADELRQHALFADDTTLDAVSYLSRPLVWTEDEIIVVQPTALANAAIQAIVRHAERQDFRTQLAAAWLAAVDREVEASLARLALLLRAPVGPYWPEAPLPCTETIRPLDRDKLLHIAIVHDDLVRSRTGNDEPAWETIPAGDDVAASLTKRALELFESDYLEVPVNGLLHLVVVQSLGASFRFVLPPGPSDPPTETLVLSAYELSALARSEEPDMVALWRVARALREARREARVAPQSQLEEYAFLRKRGWTYRHVMGGTGVGTVHLLGHARDLHVELAIRWRPRVVPGPGGDGWARVVLAHPDADVPIFVHDLPAVGRPAVAFVAPAGWHVWIVAANPTPHPQDWQEAYQWVSLVGYWLWHTLPRLTTPSEATLLTPPVVRIGPANTPDDDAAWLIGVGAGLVDVKLHQAGMEAIGAADNRAERSLMSDVLACLLKAMGQDPDAAGIAAAVDALGERHGLTLWPVQDLVMVPSQSPYRDVKEFEDLKIRRSVGRCLLKNELVAGREVLLPATGTMLNAAVDCAYTELQAAVARLAPESVLEWLVGMNETVTHTNVSRQLEASAQVFAGTPAERATTVLEDVNRPVHQTAIALRFLIEFVAAQPPSGLRPISFSAYDELLAITAFIVHVGATSDIVKHGLDEVQVAIGPDDAFHVAATRYRRGFADFVAASWQDDVDEGINYLLERARRVSEVPVPSDDTALLDRAFEDETGFTLSDHARFRSALLGLVEVEEADRFAAPLGETVEQLADVLRWPPPRVGAMVELLALRPRSDFLEPPRGLSRSDVYPWRFNRRLSYLRRPLLVRPHPSGAGEDIIFGPRHLLASWTYELESLVAGRYPARREKLKRHMATVQQEESYAFNDRVAEHFERFPDTVVQRRFHKLKGVRLGGPAEDLGDIDVLVADTRRRVLTCVETKRLSRNAAPHQIAAELKETFGQGLSKRTHVDRHLRRIAAIQDNIDDVLQALGLGTGREAGKTWTVKGLIVTDIAMASPYIDKCPIPVMSYRSLVRPTPRRSRGGT